MRLPNCLENSNIGRKCQEFQPKSADDFDAKRSLLLTFNLKFVVLGGYALKWSTILVQASAQSQVVYHSSYCLAKDLIPASVLKIPATRLLITTGFSDLEMPTPIAQEQEENLSDHSLSKLFLPDNVLDVHNFPIIVQAIGSVVYSLVFVALVLRFSIPA